MKHTSRWHHFALVFAGVATLGGSALCASLAQARTPGPTYVAADRENGGERHGRRWHKLQAKLRENDAAIHAITSGDAEALHGAVGRRSRRHAVRRLGPDRARPQPVLDTFEWVGGRFGPGGGLASEYTVIRMSGSLAYTVGFERGMAQVDGNPLVPMTIRVTQPVVLPARRLGSLMHRHADFPPADQRPGA